MTSRWPGNRVCELFGIDHPIIQAGMVYNSGARLAAAAAEAGCLGLLGAGSMRPDLLREQIRAVRALTARPFGVNLPLFYAHAAACLEVALAEGVRIFVTSAGSPQRIVGRLKREGCVSAHVVAHPGLARKCEEAGCDAVVCEGFEAGGHNGREELTTMVLVPQCVDAVKIPVIAAGGIAVGAQVAAALALGAEGVQVGSRFAITEESSGHADWKRAVVAAGPADTQLCLKPLVPVRLLRNRFRDEIMRLEATGASREALAELLGEGRARRGMLEGDLEEGELEVGQVAGLIDDVPTVAAVVARLLAGYDAAVARLAPPDRSEVADMREPCVTAERLAGLLGELCPPRGIALAGAVALPCPLPHAAAFHAWLADGRHAGLAYLARDPAARTDPTVQRPWARALLVFAQRYAAGWSPDDRSPRDGAAPGRPWTDGVARYARGRDYHDLLLADVKGVIDGLRARLGPFRAHAAVDTGPYLERECAWLAGLGFFGRNSCLIHERLGSGLFLGVAAVGLAVDGLAAAGVPAAEPLWGVTPRTTSARAPGAVVPGPASRCGSCRLCQEACPTGALDTPFALDANRCLSTWTIEWRGRAPAGEEPRQGGRLFGCDICQAVCPWNRRAARAGGAIRPEYGVDPGHAAVSLADLLEIDPEEFRRRFRRSPLWRAHPDGLRRNAATVVANGGRPAREAPW